MDMSIRNNSSKFEMFDHIFFQFGKGINKTKKFICTWI
jgi:hypothetical protein